MFHTRAKAFASFGIGILLFCFASCAKPPRTSVSPIDTPAHHYKNGMHFLAANVFNRAKQEFKLSLQLDPEYSPAYYGMGLAEGYLKNFESAYKNMKMSKSCARDNLEESQAYVGFIRLYTMQKDDDWVEDAEDAFEDSISSNPSNVSAYYYMGLAYKAGYKFREAEERFKKVIDLGKELVEEADKQWEIVQNIQRAMPGSQIATQIAVLDAIDRADLAALLIEELKLDKLFAERKKFDTDYVTPKGIDYVSESVVKAPKATDIENHVLRSDIEAALKLSIRNLKAYPDHTFRPDEPISRATFATIVEDILIKITGDESLMTKFIGSPSLYPDVRNDMWFYNAIMVCTSIGIMHAKDLSTREFRPMSSLSGANALLAIRRLKAELER